MTHTNPTIQARRLDERICNCGTSSDDHGVLCNRVVRRRVIECATVDTDTASHAVGQMLDEYEAIIDELQSELKRVNDWADGFTDKALEERRWAEETIREKIQMLKAGNEEIKKLKRLLEDERLKDE